jgi:3-hydroxyisobutyrate dehydrogenase-like beta-hydroxyacid dehydrogenase
MKSVGLIGLGNVGSYYVRVLLEAGYSLTVLDIDSQKQETSVRQGATPGNNPAEVARSADFIILALSTDEAVASVMEDEDGVLSVLKAGQVVIDTSTSRPKTAVRLEKLCEEKGAFFIDAPFTWRGPGRTQIMIVGGKADSFKRAEEMLKCLSYKYRLFGPIGTGQIVKLINQGVLAGQLAIYAEAVELTKKYGLDPKLLKEYLMFNLEEGLFSEDYRDHGELVLMYKDLGYLLEMAHDYCANIPVSILAHEIFKATTAYGKPDWNHPSIKTYFQRLNNEKL